MPRSPLRGRHLVGMNDLSPDEVRLVIDTAADLKRRHAAGISERPCEGKALVVLLERPSLRTRVSFEIAMTHLGGRAIALTPVEAGLGEREAVDDVAIVLSRWADAIVACVAEHAHVETLSKNARVPVLNGLSDVEHPCQALADLLTIREKKGALQGLKVAFVGEGGPAAASLAIACAKVGTRFEIASPEKHELPDAAFEVARAEGRRAGAEIRRVRDPREAVVGADVLCTDAWGAVPRDEDERARRLETFRPYAIDRALLEKARAGALVLHRLPARYGEEIDRDVARGPQSAIWDQVENRLHVQKALLALIL